MDKTKQIITDTGETTLHLPMGQLFYLLYSNGFSIKPDDYIEMLKITERFGSNNIDETAKWICPIIATSEAEQTKFYHIVEQYKKQTAVPKPIEDKGERISRSAKILMVVSAVVFIGLLLYFIQTPKPYQFAETQKERTVEKGESLSFDALELLQHHPEDTASIQFAWQFEDSGRKEGLRVAHVFNKAGDYVVKRHFTSGKLRLLKKSDSLLVHVCNDLPKLQINIPQATVTAQQPVTITANANAEPGTVSYYQWTINDSVFTTQLPIVQNFSFAQKGDYNVQCKAVVADINSPCTVTDNETIHVQDNGMHYIASFSPSRPGNYEGKTILKTWVTWILLLPAAGALLYSVFKRKLKPASAHPQKPATQAINGPYEIPFEQNDLKLVQQERELRRTLVQMRYKAEEEMLALSVPATINSIIRSGGSPQLVFAPLTQQQQYLILIDGANPKSMLTRLFDYLAKVFADDGIPVTVFHYDKNFACSNASFPGGITLQRLAETYSLATLIIMGNAHELVYSAYPVIEETMMRELNRWQSKVIITPAPVKDWGIKEKILQQYTVLVPADVLSLQKIIPALREKTKPKTSLFEVTGSGQYSLRDTDFREAEELKKYLNGDEALFQWFCAICIYPRLRWEVLVEMGKAILDKYGEPEKLNYSNLLKLCRIYWMQQGVFPQATRLELLKQLTVDNELCAREKLLHMLNYSTSIYGENNYFFEEDKKRQQLTNQFILHATHHTQYKQYAGSKDAFKKIWKQDALLDMPVKKYLDKTNNDTWQTPVNNGNHSVGLSTYFNQQEMAANKAVGIKRGIAAAAGILLIGLWGYIGYGGGAQKLSPMFTLHQNMDQQLVPVTMQVKKNFLACGDSLNKSFDELNGYLEINNDRLPVVWDAKASVVSFDLPYKSFAAGSANLLLGWDTNKTVTAQLNFADQLLPDTITISCVNVDTYSVIPLQVRYNDTSGYRDIESTLGDALLRFKIVSLEQVNFTDSSRIVYYEPDQKPRADSVAAIIKQSLGTNVAVEFVSEKRTPPAVPILFLNTAQPDTGTVVGPPNANKYDADSYHRMGDQYFTGKQYPKAIREYTQAITLNPKDELAYYQRGLSYEMMGAAAKAIPDYNTAIAMNSGHVSYFYRRASAKYSLKRYADAITDYNKVITMNAPEAQTQYNYSVYFRGRSYYYLNNLASACKDFKRSGDLGIKAGKQDYASFCTINPNTKPDCSKTFYSLQEALAADAAVLCKLDLSKENLTTIPKQVFGFKNLSQLNLGSTNISQSDIDRLQKSLPACKIIYTATTKQPNIDFGDIELDQNGYTNTEGQQLMEKVSRLLKAQPQGKISLTATYTTPEEQKVLTGYMNTIVNMFTKIGVNTKTQILQQISSSNQQVQQQNAQQQTAREKKMSIHVTGINLIEYPQKNATRKS